MGIVPPVTTVVRAALCPTFITGAPPLMTTEHDALEVAVVAEIAADCADSFAGAAKSMADTRYVYVVPALRLASVKLSVVEVPTGEAPPFR
jgi:hypothetical protein